MRVSTESKQTLLGLAVVGCLFGVIATMATVGFDSEYRRHSFSPTRWSATTATVFDGGVAFIGVAGLIIAIFGVAPILIRRAMARRNRGSDA